MVINKITQSEFGKFNNDMNLEFGQGINLIYGPNESGKTTVYNMLIEVLFGFSPGNRESHLYTNGNVNGIKIGAEVDGVSIQRQMLSQISGSIRQGNEVTQIANRSFVKNDFITKGIYKEIFAVSSDELTELKGNTWVSLENKILGKLNQNNISVKEVDHRMSEEMRVISKDSKRGNSKIKTLESKRIELWNQRRKTVALEEKLRAYTQSLDIEEGKLKRLLIENQGIKETIGYHSKYYDYIMKKELYTVKQAHKKAMIDSYGEALKHIDFEKMHKYKEAIESLDHKQLHNTNTRLVLNREENEIAKDVDGFNNCFKKYKSLMDEKEAVGKEQSVMDGEKDKLYFEIENTIGICTESLFKQFHKLDIPKLKGVIDRLNKCRKDDNGVNSIEIIISLGLILTGIGLYFLDNVMSLGVVSFGLLSAVRGLFSRKGRVRWKKDDKDNEILDDLEFVFGHTKIRDISLGIVDEIFYNKCIILKGQVHEYGEKINTIMRKKEKNSAQMSLVKLSFKGSDKIINLENLTQVESIVESAMDKVKYNKTVDQNMDLTKKEIKYFEELLKRQEVYFEQIDKVDNENCNELVDSYLTLCESTEKVKKEIDNNVHYANISQEVSNISKKLYNDIKHSDILELNQKLLESSESIDGVYDHINEIKKENFILEEMDSLTVIDSELKFIEDEMEQLKNQWNILKLLKRTIEISEVGFKNRIQPEIIKRAEGYLNQLTSGEHNALLLVEEEGHKKIVVDKMYNQVLSKGTYQQLYLSLRVALMDLIDDEVSKLPIFFDEVLAHWDDERAENLMELLKVVSKERQVFMFTCKKDIREMFLRYPEVRVIEMG